MDFPPDGVGGGGGGEEFTASAALPSTDEEPAFTFFFFFLPPVVNSVQVLWLSPPAIWQFDGAVQRFSVEQAARHKPGSSCTALQRVRGHHQLKNETKP